IKQNLFVGSKNGLYMLNSIVNVKNEDPYPTKFKLYQNYPNPFNPTTTIKYSIFNVGSENFAVSTKLIVYDILGNEVAMLVNEARNSGNYEVTFDASNLSSGVYYYQLKAGEFSETKKMILLK
ncbi:MAG: T9SS type A sorting domain-containing protein, partial [Bacteroidota bacterium]